MQARKRLITYHTINVIVALRKRVNSNHPNIYKKFEEETNYSLREDEKQPSRKETKCFF
jgi:predicted phage-related endonuclease